MKATIYPCVWHDGTALQAAELYTSVFTYASITERSPTPNASVPPAVVTCQLENLTLMLLNGGPQFAPNPSVSVLVRSGSRTEIDRLWQGLNGGGGETLMALDRYDWSPYYGWLEDRWGFTWQLMLDETVDAQNAPILTPALLFTRENFGKAEAALTRYEELLPGATIRSSTPFPSGEHEGKLQFAELGFAGGSVRLMDDSAAHEFTFGEGVSLVVWCEDQAELNRIWDGLIDGGGTPGRCGWLVDAFGVSWQVLPRGMMDAFADPVHGGAAMQAMMGMSKLDLAALRAAR